MIINANALNIPLADKSAQMIVTSPPYWGLRDYGTATWQGGEAGCNHKQAIHSTRGGPKSTIKGGQDTTAHEMNYRDTCGKCGAIRIDNQLGLERAPEEYIANMVAVFRECKRVLRDDGSLWLNCGDSYYNYRGANNRRSDKDLTKRITLEKDHHNIDARPNEMQIDGLKGKDLVGIPWRLAFALQADGWYLRSDIIWNKPNPMPESVTDRPTKSHEYLFLLTKSQRYYYDAEAIKEDAIKYSAYKRAGTKNDRRVDNPDDPSFRNGHSQFERDEGLYPNSTNGRNARTVWTIPTAPYKGAHFATFPPALVEPCIKAGTSERGACPKCGKGWRRVVDHKNMVIDRSDRIHELGRTRSSGTMLEPAETNTIGWQPACNCSAAYDGMWMAHDDPGYVPYEPIPCLVFDPFVGSGTTVKVAYDLGRRGVGLDLSLEYLDEQARKRIHNGHYDRLF